MDVFELLKKFRASKTEGAETSKTEESGASKTEDDASVYDVFEVKDCCSARYRGVQVLTSVGVDIPADGEGCVFLLGTGLDSEDRVRFLNKISKLTRHCSSPFYAYKLRVLDVPEDVVDALGYNIVCPVFNPLYDRIEFVTVFADPSQKSSASGDSISTDGSSSIIGAALAVVDEAQWLLRCAGRDALLLDAYSHPDEFVEAVNQVYDNPESLCSTSDDDSDEVGFFRNMDSALLFHLSGNLKYSISLSRHDDAGIFPADISSEELSEKKAKKKKKDYHFLRYLTAQDRKEMLLKIPDKMTASFEKQDPDTTRFVNEVADNLSAEEMRAVLKLIYSRHKGIAQQTIYQITGGASNYELVIRPRGEKQPKFYRDKLWYFMYLKDSNGVEMPLIFKHAPAYCIYVMHVIDRYRNRENTRVLDLRQHREEFIEVYEALFQEDRAQIEHYYDELETRVNESTGKRRVGRYNDYIRDIHQTLERRLGTINSMPFKIGANQFLSLLPSKIQLPPTLANIKIS